MTEFSGGAEPGSLVEEATATVGAKLSEYFSSVDGRRQFPLSLTAKLLDSHLPPLILAAHDAGFIPETAGQTVTDKKLKTAASNIKLDQLQVVELNTHPFVRTVNEQILGGRHEVQTDFIVEIAKENNLVPVARPPQYGKPDPEDPYFYRGFFDLDQQAIVAEKAALIEADKYHITVDAVKRRMELSDEEFDRIQRVIEFNTKQFYVPKSGKREAHLHRETAYEIWLVLERAKAQRLRREGPAPEGLSEQDN
jgi:hypothetical protein